MSCAPSALLSTCSPRFAVNPSAAFALATFYEKVSPMPQPIRRVLRGLCFGVALSTLLAGCGTFSNFSLASLNPFGSEKKKPLPLADVSGNVLGTSWRAAVGKSRGYLFSPAVSDGKVYVAAGDGQIQVFDEASGQAVSKIETGGPITAGVGVAQGLVTVVNDKGDLLAYQDGKLAWRANIAAEVLTPPEVGPGIVVVRPTDGRVLAFNSADGKRRWVFTRATPSLTLRAASGVVVTRTEVVVGYPGGRLLALDLDTGKLLAEFSVATPRGASDLERVVDVAGTPYLETRRICAVTFQGRVACFDPSNGSTLWAKDASSASGLAADGKNLYIALDDGSVQALTKEAGASVWKNDKLLHRALSQPLVVGNFVVVGDHLGLVHVLSPETGALVGRLTTDGSPVQSITAMGNQAVAQTAAGGVFALKL
jgi:outer membrane protein assembly factor BamB